MTAKLKFKSDAFEVIHSSATALFKVGAMDKATLRNFDESCLSIPGAIEPDYNRLDRPEMGARGQATERNGIEVADSRAKARH